MASGMNVTIYESIGKDDQSPEELPAKHVFLLMRKEFRISRNVRAQWFFKNLNNKIEIRGGDDGDTEDLCVFSVIPHDPPPHWTVETALSFTYKLLPSTVVTFLAKKYRIVFCIDISPSVVLVDAKSGDVILDKMITSLYKCLKGLTSEFIVPGCCQRFAPQFYVTVIVHSSSLLHPNQQVVIQGWLLTASNLQEFLCAVQHQLIAIENYLASCTSYLNERSAPRCSNSSLFSETPASPSKCFGFAIDDDKVARSQTTAAASLMVPENSFINLLRYGILALQLLPDNTTAAIVVITDGVINVPDIHVFQSLLNQLRNSTVSCSFLHVSSSCEPSSCWGYAPFSDLMRFIATSTYGMYLPCASEACIQESPSMNVYHQGLLTWSFQWAPYADKLVLQNLAVSSQSSGISVLNLNFSLKDDFHVETKKHTEKNIAASLETLLSCRLREGYGVQDVVITDGNHIEVFLLLPWKHDVSISYVASSTWPLDNTPCHYKVIVKGSYEFLHDLTCTTKKPIKSVFRSSVVKKFFEALQQLRQTDELLAHLHSFASNSAYYLIPESIRNGVPLFYLSSGSTQPVLCSSDFPCPKFAEFWEPVCMLDINIWQKWMHTHRIGLIMAHDRPIPKHLHVANANGRYSTVQCRQAVACLNSLLNEWSSFVLIENHSYIKLLFGDPDKPPVSFYIIRVISQAPCIIIRLAFLGGTPSHVRNEIIGELCKRIQGLSLPSRANLKASVAGTKVAAEFGCLSDAGGGGEGHMAAGDFALHIPCCTQFLKPVERLLIRYERTPRDYDNPTESLIMPRNYLVLERVAHQKVSRMFSTLGRYLYHKRWVWSAQCDPTVIIAQQALSKILNTLTKIRLQKGFHFAHSHSGIINMVLEVQMQTGDGGEMYPCILQSVLFPPNDASPFHESLSEEDPEFDGDSAEMNAGEQQLVTECWVEPQYGYVTKTNLETQILEGLDYKQLPEASNSCETELWQPSRESLDPSMEHVRFPYDLTKLLSKCAQAELIFGTLAEGFKVPVTEALESSTANRLLLCLVHEGLRSTHDCEVPLSREECLKLPQLLRQREKFPGRVGCNHIQSDDAGDGCNWKCYAKGFGSSRLLLTFLPATFEDVMLLDSVERVLQPENGLCSDSSANCGCHFALPIYAVDCSLPSLIAAIVYGAPSVQHTGDVFHDYRPNRCSTEEICTTCSSSRSDESSKLLSPEPRTEDSVSPSSGKLQWKLHINNVAMVYYNCFISAIYHCLQKKIPVSKQDIQSSVEEMCIETALEIDVTEFLQTVCLHVSHSDSSAVKEERGTSEDLSESNCAELPCPWELIVPSLPDLLGPCASLQSIHATIQLTFDAIMNRWFANVPTHPDYHYYNPPSLKKTISLLSIGMAELEDGDHEMVQFNVEDVSGATRASRTSFGTDVESDDGAMYPSVSSGEEAPVAQCRRSSGQLLEGEALPLFVHLVCSISDRQSQKVINKSVRTLPTCFGHVSDCLSRLEWQANDRIDMSNVRVTLDVLCLTLPPEVEAALGQKNCSQGTTSFCSSSPVVHDSLVRPSCGGKEGYCPGDDYQGSASKNPLGHVPHRQRIALANCVDEIKWMLRDEITSFARDAYPINEAILETVASHVRDSSGRPGCYASHVPLQFVFGPENSLDKFLQEFRHMSLHGGYRLVHEGKYYYVALKCSLETISKEKEEASPLCLARKYLVVQQRNPHQNDSTLLHGIDALKESFKESSVTWPRTKASSVCEFSDNEESEDAGALSDGQKAVKARRSLACRLRAKGNRSKSESELGNPVIVKGFGRHMRKRTVLEETSLNEEDEVDNTVASVKSDSAIAVARSDTEDGGYDGDDDDDDNDGVLLGESDSKRPQLPPFWLIMQVLADHVDIFFQFRHAEDDVDGLAHHKSVTSQLIQNIKSICKMVNQALLLQDLHDSRMCNQLLEPEASEDIWKQEEISPLVPISSGRRWSTWVPAERVGSHEEFVDCQDTYLEATMKFMPGAFVCPIVWEIHFILHPRLKTGHGRTSTSRGVQALKSVLSRLSVSNRKNMFVYKEGTDGAVFYIRLHEIPPGLLATIGEPLHQVAARHSSVVDDTGSLGESRSSSMQSLIIGRNCLDPGEDLPEPRSRVNSMPEKDRDQSQDSMSVSSRVSGRQKSTEDVITLSIHGITEAGTEIKEDLVRALQSRLDDAVLDVISVTLARNPMCKLTPEDVQFIQKSGSPPNAVCHFTVQVQVLPFLQAIVFYLCQNLLQFLNVPKYVDTRGENHFQRFCSNVNVDLEPPSVFLYIMPQEAGSRGVACIVLSVVDNNGDVLQYSQCPQTDSDAYKVGLSRYDFENLTYTCIYPPDKGQRKTPGPMALIEVQIWEKGKVDLEQLISRLQVAIRHALWDVVTEYRLLMAPLCEMPHVDDSTISSEPSTPLKAKPHDSQQPLSCPSSHYKDARVSSPRQLLQAKLCKLSLTLVPDLVARCRSPVWSSSRGGFMLVSQAGSPTSRVSTVNVEEEIHVAMDAEVLRRREKYELGEKGTLHDIYASVIEQWLEFAKQIGVPSVQKHCFTLTSRHTVLQILREMSKLIGNSMSDTIPRTFRKEMEFVPFNSMCVGRDRRKVGGAVLLDASKKVPGKGSEFLMIGRNFRQWRACSGRLEDLTEIDNKSYKDLQRFSPLVHFADADNYSGDVKRESTFMPRQRLLLVIVIDCQISVYTYNWAHDLASSLVDECCKLVELQNMRSCFLSSVVFQKLGLFLDQPFSRKCTATCRVPGLENKGKCIECADLELFLKSSSAGAVSSVPRRDVSFSHRQRRSTASHHHPVPFGDVFRDAKPQCPIRASGVDPVWQHAQQFQEIRNADNRELQKQLVSMWHNRESRVSVQHLRQISRVEHYCLTPILFQPIWRLHVALARDHTWSSFPDGRLPVAGCSALVQHRQQVEHPASGLVVQLKRSRHGSEVSTKFSDARSQKRSNSHTSVLADPIPPGPKTVCSVEEWHTNICSAYVAEFVQYLQTLGFVGFRFPRSQKSNKNQPGRFEAAVTEEHDCASGRYSPQYFQKFLLGGIILLELVFCEPYFGVKMFTMESMRLRSLNNRVLNSQFVVAFLDECDKIKVCMHLHSFTYDYHLRSIHSYISGRQMTLRQKYHIVSFLDDFTQYYQKSPNFARNLVHQGVVTIGPTSCTPKQLFEYLLKYDRLYEMRCFQMVRHSDADEVEYILVQMSTHKVAYRDSSDTRQMDEFDVSLLISLDSSRTEFRVLSLRYYIILTSCREMYPKPVAEKQPGTFRTVVSTSLPLSRPPSCTPSSGPGTDETEDGERSDSSQVVGDCGVAIQRSTDSRDELNSCELTDTTGSTTGVHDREVAVVATQLGSRHGGIRQEIVNYLGYFSSHEELMHKIIMEQAEEAKCHIDSVVNKAIVDCRRDSLWERLQRGLREAEEGHRKKEDSRELHGMTYVEFMDLLSLVSRRPLTDVDSRLATFAIMPVNWYQTLVKVFLNKYQDRHHHFTASDGNTQHIVILGGTPSNWFVLLSIDLHTNGSELCVVCREPTIEWNSCIYALVEDVVNACCFHMWSVLL